MPCYCNKLNTLYTEQNDLFLARDNVNYAKENSTYSFEYTNYSALSIEAGLFVNVQEEIAENVRSSYSAVLSAMNQTCIDINQAITDVQTDISYYKALDRTYHKEH